MAKHWRALVLNADYLPLSTTSAVRAATVVSRRKAHALELSANRLTSEHESVCCPSVIVLSQYQKVMRRHVTRFPLREAIFRRDAGSCQYCGAPATTIDHIVARCAGGSDDFSNVVACCQPCNAKKGARPLSRTSMRLRQSSYGRPPDAVAQQWGASLFLQHLVEESAGLPRDDQLAWRKWVFGDEEAAVEAEAAAEAAGRSLAPLF